MKTVTKRMYEASDGTLFDKESEAEDHEQYLESQKKKQKANKLKEKIKSLFPKSAKVVRDKEFERIISQIPSCYEHEIDLVCQSSGMPLRVYKTKFHDSGHQYEKSYSERLEMILSRKNRILKIGDIVRSYSEEEYMESIVPVIEKNKNTIKTYLLYYFTGII